MKIALLSDLHLSVHAMSPPAVDADVLVLAGDLHRPVGAIEWARQYAMPTLFVAGNHEFYGSDLVSTVRALRRHAEGSSVRVLEHDVWQHGSVRFLGCTLWSDYRLYDSPQHREQGLQQASTMVRDFSRIRVAPDFDDKFTPAVAQLLFDDAVAWLEQQFAITHDGPTVVVTHFAPARGSIAAQFAGSPLNACFRLRPRATDPSLATCPVVARPCARQLRLPHRQHPRGRQPARLCAKRGGREQVPSTLRWLLRWGEPRALLVGF